MWEVNLAAFPTRLPIKILEELPFLTVYFKRIFSHVSSANKYYSFLSGKADFSLATFDKVEF